jgi:hypothetical protein
MVLQTGAVLGEFRSPRMAGSGLGDVAARAFLPQISVIDAVFTFLFFKKSH